MGVIPVAGVQVVPLISRHPLPSHRRPLSPATPKPRDQGAESTPIWGRVSHKVSQRFKNRWATSWLLRHHEPKGPCFSGEWRRGWDSNPRYRLTPYNGLANRRLQPLGHPSAEVTRLTTHAVDAILPGSGVVKQRSWHPSKNQGRPMIPPAPSIEDSNKMSAIGSARYHLRAAGPAVQQPASIRPLSLLPWSRLGIAAVNRDPVGRCAKGRIAFRDGHHVML